MLRRGRMGTKRLRHDNGVYATPKHPRSGVSPSSRTRRKRRSLRRELLTTWDRWQETLVGDKGKSDRKHSAFRARYQPLVMHHSFPNGMPPPPLNETDAGCVSLPAWEGGGLHVSHFILSKNFSVLASGLDECASAAWQDFFKRKMSKYKDTVNQW